MVKGEDSNVNARAQEEKRHLELVEGIVSEGGERKVEVMERSSLSQQGRREREMKVREEAVEYRLSMVGGGRTLKEAAQDLGTSSRTMAYWAARSKAGSLGAPARGRPLKDSGSEKRNQVIEFIRDVGPGVGVGRIRGAFPHMPRCEVVETLARFRRAYIHDHRLLVHELEWTKPGAVWALDHAEATEPIDGRFPAVLSVRDLSSGNQLLWKPVEDMTGALTVAEIEALIEMEGAPLVLKSDNGPAFISEEMRGLLNSHEIFHLLSPPGLPQYNGACESGIGAMKDRTTWKAALGGRPRKWTSEDMEAARIDANEIPPGPGCPSSGELWRSRNLILPELRASFQEAVSKEDSFERWGRMGPAAPRGEAEIQRRAIRRALVARGILKIRRRWIPLPKKLLKRAKIS